MEIDNQTNDPIDYEQTGSTGGPAEDKRPEEKGPPCPRTGNAPAESSATFVPCGRPPFTVVLSDGGGQSCTVGDVTSRRATLTVHDLGTCDITVNDPSD